VSCRIRCTRPASSRGPRGGRSMFNAPVGRAHLWCGGSAAPCPLVGKRAAAATEGMMLVERGFADHEHGPTRRSAGGMQGRWCRSLESAAGEVSGRRPMEEWRDSRACFLLAGCRGHDAMSRWSAVDRLWSGDVVQQEPPSWRAGRLHCGFHLGRLVVFCCCARR
jgi:hypothetical protein